MENNNASVMTQSELQAASELDLNTEQDCHSPKISHLSASESSPSSKNDTNVDDVIKIGMEFESDEEAYKYYKDYAGLVGFHVRKDWVNRSKVHGRVISRKFTCHKEGYRKRDKRDVNVKKHRKETRTGCLAHMTIIRQPNGKYRVAHFVTDHNHEKFNPTNAQKLQKIMLPGNFETSETASASKSETSSKLSHQLLDTRFDVPEYVGDVAIDYNCNLKSGRARDMNEGEAGRLLCYFQRQHFENPSFFYSVQLDIDDKVSNIFWADDHMVLDYDHFGDVICLDTTYRLDATFRPLVLFSGLNHYRQVVIFGAALLYDDTVDSFKWLIRTFVQSMSGKKPKAVVTDQDATIIQAIASDLPEVNHGVCTLQIYQNALKNLRHLANDEDSFAKDFKSCVFDLEDEEDLVHAWEAMLDKYSLRENKWLRWMFSEKEKWASAYSSNTFFIESNVGHLVEKVFNNLKSYLNPEVDVLQLYKVFEIAVNKQRSKEIEATHESSTCVPRLMANVLLLKQASEAYTPRAFEVFQREYKKSLNIVVDKCCGDGSVLEYKASAFGKSREYFVTFNSLNQTVACSCMKFEQIGFLCSHALKVMDHQNVKSLPAQYISKRWTRDGRVSSVTGSSSYGLEEKSRLLANRYKDLCKNILKISAMASESHQAYEYAVRKLDEVMGGVERVLTKKSCEGTQTLTSSSAEAEASECEAAEIVLRRNTIEDQGEDDISTEPNEMDSASPDENRSSGFDEQIANTNRNYDVQRSAPKTDAAITNPLAACSSFPTRNLNSLPQGLYSFQTNHMDRCMYPSSNVTMNQQCRPTLCQSQSYYTLQNDERSQASYVQNFQHLQYRS